MAAHAAATSLINLLEHVQSYHDRNEILLDDQLKQLASIQEKVSSFQNYLEKHHTTQTKVAVDLEGRIADTCYKAEDVIESYIVGYIHSKNHEGGFFTKLSTQLASFLEEVCCLQRRLKETPNIFSQVLEMVIDEMDSIKKEVKVIEENGSLEYQQGLSFTPVDSIKPPTTQSDIFVGHKDLFDSVIDKIRRGKPDLQLIPITGMGGIGKTMFARKVYDSPHAKDEFHIHGWVTISQVYDVEKLLLRLLSDMKAKIEGKGENLAVHELGKILYQHLYGRRYLVVLDDMWSIDAWKKIQEYFPDESKTSRVLVTSRSRQVANDMDSSNHFEMNLLDENESWELFHGKVFGKEICPPEFMEVGKKIARNCKGLPLSLIVIGGLLAKSKMILGDWEQISANISEMVNSADNESHLMLLSLSYDQLPVHLKPCFLYMGAFAEDEEIRVSRLINLLVAEGFVKPIQGRSMEEVAHSYLTDLTDRNLIFVSRRKRSGIIRDCKIHDLLRGLCLREAKKCRFLSFISEKDSITQDISRQRRIGVQAMTLRFSKTSFPDSNYEPPEICTALKSASFLRSVVEYSPGFVPVARLLDDEYYYFPLVDLNDFKLLRVLDVTEEYHPQEVFGSVNARYISHPTIRGSYSFSSLNLLWNLQTLVMGNVYYNEFIRDKEFIVPSAMWEMAQLRQVKIYDFVMPKPPNRKDCCDFVVQKNLQTLLQVRNFRLTKEILNGRPNIKKLKIVQKSQVRFSDYLLNNLVFLGNLQSFYCGFREQYSRTDVLEGIKFPASLKKLTLAKCPLNWDDLATTVGDLPQLEVLELRDGCRGEVWNPQVDHFRKLKRLKITFHGPQQWNVESTHFPVLEELHLFHTEDMIEIPSGIGEIESLKSIYVSGGCASLVDSAKELESQQDDGYGFELIIKELELMEAIQAVLGMDG